MTRLAALSSLVAPLLVAQSPPLHGGEQVGSSASGLAIADDIDNRGVIVGQWDSGTAFAFPRPPRPAGMDGRSHPWRLHDDGGGRHRPRPRSR